MILKMGPGNCAFLHLNLVPWIPAAGELKTKPTQHSVQKLREIGIMPDALLCRAVRPSPDEERAKISLFATVHVFGVFSVWDVDTIYKVPRMLHAQGLDELISAGHGRNDGSPRRGAAAPGATQSGGSERGGTCRPLGEELATYWREKIRVRR